MQALYQLDFLLRDSAQLSWGGVRADSGGDHLGDGSGDVALGGDPVPDLVWNDFNDGDTGIVVITLVNAVVQVAKVRRRTARPVLLDLGLILADRRLAAERRPAGGGGVAVRDVDVGVVGEFVEFVRDVVGDEDEAELGGGFGGGGDHCAGVKLAISSAGGKHRDTSFLDQRMEILDLLLGCDRQVLRLCRHGVEVGVGDVGSLSGTGRHCGFGSDEE